MKKWLSLPETATAPFCPSEVQGSIQVEKNDFFLKKLFKFLGPGLLIAVGYMDPGNWATDIEAGSKFGYALLFVVLFSSAAAMILQYLAAKLGVVTQKDLAQHCREHYSKNINFILWIFAEVAIIATDVAEVLGSALAFKLLLGVSLEIGVLLTILDTIIVLGLKGKGFRQVESIILGLIATISISFLIELFFLKPDWHEVVQGYKLNFETLSSREPWYVAIGIIGATIMPHNLYLHSSIVQTRTMGQDEHSLNSTMKLVTIDTIVSLSFAFIVNSAILILAAGAFHKSGFTQITEIDEAYRLLEPILGGAFASVIFGVALLASGQSSTFTGTIAGQVVMEGYLDWKIPCWKRRLITRTLALIPALIGVMIVGNSGTGKLLVLSQVILSFQLPFAMFPLITLTNNKKVMKSFANSKLLKIIVWILFIIISMSNVWLVCQWIF